MRLIVDDVHMASGHLQEHFRQAGSAQDFYFPQREPKAAATLSPGHPPASLGIFGLSHEELLQSEWVENDTHRLHSSSFLWFVFRTTGCPVFSKQLTGRMQERVSKVIVIEDCQVIGVESLLAASDKYQIKRLRLWCPAKFSEEINASQVCDILSSDMHALLEEGNCSDVQFMVQEEVIHVIVIEDCEFVTFKAFLQFLYTDELSDAQNLYPQGTSNESDSESGSPQLSRIQALLAVSHKYQVKRLQPWCEVQLSEQVEQSQVCGMLCQAHLLQARQLEKVCLSFIKEFAALVSLSSHPSCMARKGHKSSISSKLPRKAAVRCAEIRSTVDDIDPALFLIMGNACFISSTV
ncbi:BPM3 [Symbiodinium necroappetens]|uniref:BPM3 protein n=1 Tax=Symbiodinium necroappetens TaxID=1628268 RepID=A0A812ZX72_9DINO|nr:BPM3 [Symbiodinium necroappetens]